MATGANGWLQIGGQDLTNRYDPRLWGTAGNLWANNIDTAADRDPRYWMRTQNPGDDSGGFQWQLRPEVAQQLNGRVQVGSAGVGGAGEVIDPSRLEYDQTYGYLTRPENIRTPQNSGLSNFLSDNMVGIVAALANPAVAMGSGSLFQAGGMFGPSGGQGMQFGPGGGLDHETWGGAGGMGSGNSSLPMNFGHGLSPEAFYGEGFAGAAGGPVDGYMMGLPGEAAGAAAGAPVDGYMMGLPGAEAGAVAGAPAAAGGGSWLSNLGGAIAANPLRAISTGLQIGGLLGGALGGGGMGGGGGGSRPSGGLSGGLLGGNARRPQWSPNQHSMAQLRALYPGRF